MQEHVLQIGWPEGEVIYWHLAKSPEKWSQFSAHGKLDLLASRCFGDHAYTLQRRKPLPWDGFVQDDFHPPLPQRLEVRDLLDRHEPSVPDDGDAVGDPLDLQELVRREEDRLAARLLLPQKIDELHLHQRVEAAARLVQDQ